MFLSKTSSWPVNRSASEKLDNWNYNGIHSHLYIKTHMAHKHTLSYIWNNESLLRSGMQWVARFSLQSLHLFVSHLTFKSIPLSVDVGLTYLLLDKKQDNSKIISFKNDTKLFGSGLYLKA